MAVLAGLLFKAGAVPRHFWVPDAAEGTGVGVAAFLTTVPKIGGLAAIYRLITEAIPAATNLALVLMVLAAASMTLGNLAAFWQNNVRRLLAHSTISQVGYLMIAPAAAGATLAASQYVSTCRRVSGRPWTPKRSMKRVTRANARRTGTWSLTAGRIRIRGRRRRDSGCDCSRLRAVRPGNWRIFSEYLDGTGDRAIAAGLNRGGIPCPSARRPDQNRHRLADGWQCLVS